LREVGTNNIALKEILNEKNSKIAHHEKEAA